MIDRLSEQEYRAYDRESYSSIKHILKSPNDFLHNKEKPFKGSTASLLGTCTHHYLQGNKHLVAFQPLPNLKKNEIALREFKNNFLVSVGEDGIIVPVSFEIKLQIIARNYMENDKAYKALSKCEFEKAYLFKINDVPFKGKVDGVADTYIVEIKTSSQATTREEFQQEAYDRDYDLQAYMYLVGSKKQDHYFIVVNTVDPFKVSIYKSSVEFIESGKKKAFEATERYKKYIINKEVWDDNKEIESI